MLVWHWALLRLAFLPLPLDVRSLTLTLWSLRFGRYALVATLWSLRFKTILADYNHTPLLTLNEAGRVIQLLLIIRKEN